MAKPLVFKTAAKAWIYNQTKDVTSITRTSTTATATLAAHGYSTGDSVTIAGAGQAAYNGTFTVTRGSPRAVTSITRSSSTATVTQTSHPYATGDNITIAGANQAEYNGTFEITDTGANTYTYTVSGTPATPATGTITASSDVNEFSYTVSGTPATPATGTITATGDAIQIIDEDYPATTVPGIVHLDGTYYVMDADGVVYGSDLEDPSAWNALNFITAETEIDLGVGITKYLNYLIAFGQWSTEFFYNAEQTAPASPLLRAENMFLQVGCANARSMQHSENSVIWLGQTKDGHAATGGRSIMQYLGTQLNVISTPYIDKILDEDDLSTVYSMAFKYHGHPFYVITLVNSAITLVYDLSTKLWYQWTSLTAQESKSVTSITRSGSVATATCASHGYADGDVVTIAGAGQAEYNGVVNITYVDSSTFTYEVSGTPATPATGTLTATGYTESYFKQVWHTAVAGVNYLGDLSTGKLYPITETAYDDNGVPINMLIRTSILDGGNNDYKAISGADIIGDRVSGNALVRYSKTDYTTFSTYRKVDLSLARSHLNRIGRARRISFDIRITDNIPVRLERMDITIEGGE